MIDIVEVSESSKTSAYIVSSLIASTEDSPDKVSATALLRSDPSQPGISKMTATVLWKNLFSERPLHAAVQPLRACSWQRSAPS